MKKYTKIILNIGTVILIITGIIKIIKTNIFNDIGLIYILLGLILILISRNVKWIYLKFIPSSIKAFTKISLIFLLFLRTFCKELS